MSNRISGSRLKERLKYDTEVIYPILDEAIVCTICYCKDGMPYSIPNSFVRMGGSIFVHGSAKSHFLDILRTGVPVCVVITLLDGLVLARSVFHHSMNYRSVVLFGTSREVMDEKKKWSVLKAFTQKIIPGRWEDARQPSDGEMKATAVVEILIEEISAKVRTGPAGDDKRDMDMDVWAGVLPLKKGYGDPEPNPDLREGVALPSYLSQLGEEH